MLLAHCLITVSHKNTAQAMFQLKLGPLPHCSIWEVANYYNIIFISKYYSQLGIIYSYRFGDNNEWYWFTQHQCCNSVKIMQIGPNH